LGTPQLQKNKAASQVPQDNNVEKDGFDDIPDSGKIFKRRLFFFPQLLTDQACNVDFQLYQNARSFNPSGITSCWHIPKPLAKCPTTTFGNGHAKEMMVTPICTSILREGDKIIISHQKFAKPYGQIA